MMRVLGLDLTQEIVDRLLQVNDQLAMWQLSRPLNWPLFKLKSLAK